jgi:vancomycin resistance protein VanJ
MARAATVVAIGYAAAVVAALVALRLAADRWWPATLLAFGPRWVLGLPLPFVAILVSVARRWRWLVPVAIAAVALALVVDLRVPVGRASPGATPALAVLTLNADGTNTQPARLRRLLEDESIAIAAVQECDLESSDWSDGTWTFQRDKSMCLLSRFPIRDVEARDRVDILTFGGHGAAVRYTVDTPGGALTIVNLHLATAREGLSEVLEHGFGGRAALAANSAMRDRESATIRAWVDGVTAGKPAVVMGDFNMPVESAVYRRHWASFPNAFSRCGSGLGWSKRTRRFGTRIDHMLLAGGVACENAHLAPGIGSDHRGVVARLALPAPR